MLQRFQFVLAKGMANQPSCTVKETHRGLHSWLLLFLNPLSPPLHPPLRLRDEIIFSHAPLLTSVNPLWIPLKMRPESYFANVLGPSPSNPISDRIHNHSGSTWWVVRLSSEMACPVPSHCMELSASLLHRPSLWMRAQKFPLQVSAEL